MARKKVVLEFPFEHVVYARKQKNLPDGAEQVVVVHKSNGTTYLAHRTVKPAEERRNVSAATKANNEKFKQAALKTNEIMMDVEKIEPYRTQWRNSIAAGNKRYTTLRGYIFAMEYKKL